MQVLIAGIVRSNVRTDPQFSFTIHAMNFYSTHGQEMDEDSPAGWFQNVYSAGVHVISRDGRTMVYYPTEDIKCSAP